PGHVPMGGDAEDGLRLGQEYAHPLEAPAPGVVVDRIHRRAVPDEQDRHALHDARLDASMGTRMPADSPPKVFLLSPARAGGIRMGLLLSPRANFELAWQFQEKGAPIGELFQFASGLYFRGKLAYARAFGRAPAGGAGALAIAP